MKRSVFIILVLFIGHSLHSQEENNSIIKKWGEISEYEKNLNQCEFDSTAKAVTIFNLGIMNFGAKDGFRTYVHKRMKIFNKDVINELATIGHYRITHEYNDDQILYGAKEIKAQSINYDEDGNEIITELDKKDIWMVDNIQYFTIPNVKVGSIIEYSYVTQSWSLNDNEWYFQENIPTLESSFELFTGKHKLNIVPILVGNRLINKYKRQDSNKWTLKNSPSVEEEFAAALEDYAEHIILKPSGYYKTFKVQGDYNNLAYEYRFVDYENTWEEISNSIHNDQEYKSYLSHDNAYKKILNNIIVSEDDPKIKMIKIYNYVKNNYSWDGITTDYINKDKRFSDFKNSRSGNSGEINLFLTRLLQVADLNAQVALTRTRDKGKVIEHIPLKSQFNQLLAFVAIGDKKFFLNATDYYRPYYMLNKYDYNSRALIIEAENTRWEDMPLARESKKTIQITLNIENDSAKFQIKIKAENQEALKQIKYFKSTSLEDAISNKTKELFSHFEDFKFIEFTHSPFEVNSEAFITSYKINVPLSAFENNDYYKFGLNQILGVNSNPFMKETRQLPIDFNFRNYDKVILSIKADPSFKIINDPLSIRLKLPYDGGFFTGSIMKQSEQQLMMISTLKIAKDFYFVDEYKTLRELFIQMIDFEEQEIFLEKI